MGRTLGPRDSLSFPLPLLVPGLLRRLQSSKRFVRTSLVRMNFLTESAVGSKDFIVRTLSIDSYSGSKLSSQSQNDLD